VIPFFAFRAPVRRIIDVTNAIEKPQREAAQGGQIARPL